MNKWLQYKYIKAVANLKFWYKREELAKNNPFDGEKSGISESILSNVSFSDTPFPEPNNSLKLNTNPLQSVILSEDGRRYEIELHEPLLEYNKNIFKIGRKRDDEYLGEINSEITGYIIINEGEGGGKNGGGKNDGGKNGGGKNDGEKNGGGKNDGGKNDGGKNDEGKNDGGKNDGGKNESGCLNKSKGCLGWVLKIALVLLGLIFLYYLIKLLPVFLSILFILFLFLLFILLAGFLVLISEFLIGLIFIIAIFFLIKDSYRSSNIIPKPKPIPITPKPAPKPITTDSTAVIVPINPNADSTTNNNQTFDSLITHYSSWQDYNGNFYEGKFWVRKSDFKDSKYYKQNKVPSAYTEDAYDYMLFALKEKDLYKLDGLYYLFDSIQNKKNLSQIKFAEMIVSFIQDIPYTLILSEACDPDLYNDEFSKNYLSEENARCEGFQKFGINTPVEFMATLNGDCDTRTLLLYTILAHYGYDVAILSSEYYSHSILGVNLPIYGDAYQYRDQRYVLWETTTKNRKPGEISYSYSNLDYWRISLKSK